MKNDHVMQALAVAALALAWIAGFTTAYLLLSRGTDAGQPTTREAQIERYEDMGR